MTRWQQVCRFCFAEGVPRRSLLVAAVIGTVLNLINQGDALIGEAPVNYWKLVLTYLVPYCVATYGAVSYRLQKEHAVQRGELSANAEAARSESMEPR